MRIRLTITFRDAFGMNGISSLIVLLVGMYVVSASSPDKGLSPAVCIVKDTAPHATLQPVQARFTDVAQEAGLVERQCFIRTTPNCLFKQYDPSALGQRRLLSGRDNDWGGMYWRC